MKFFIKKLVYKLGYRISKSNLNNCEYLRLSYLLDLLSTCYLIDVGANIGQFAHNLRIAGYEDYIFSIEPLPDAHKVLKAQSKNDRRWFVVENLAVSDYSGETQINITSKSACSSLLKPTNFLLNSLSFSKLLSTQTVKVETISKVVSTYLPEKVPFALKIDTQGNEYDVLKGAASVISRCSLVYVETSEIPLYDGCLTSQDIILLMQSYGFDIWFKDLNIVNPTDCSAIQYDICFVNRKFLPSNSPQN